MAARGELSSALAVTMARVAAAFALAMALGSALGYAMGRRRLVDRLADPWIVVLLNLPALVIIVLLYIWVGLNEVAAIAAVALNKLPNATVTIREGVRTLDPGLDEMARAFAFSPLEAAAPCRAAAARALFRRGDRDRVCRWCGRSCWWSNCWAARTASASRSARLSNCSTFPLLLAYALPFTAAMLMIETFLVQPFERHVSRWRTRPA